jgi:hypothetical protein
MTMPAGIARSTLYRQLDEAHLVATIARLRDRIEERFPGSGLGRVASELYTISGEAIECVTYLRQPHWPLRIGIYLAIATMVAVLLAVATAVPLNTRLEGLPEFVQTVESAINDLVFFGVAVFFLLTAESRLKRKRALPALHDLRSVIHIVDMHQLTKDPEHLLSAQRDTASSPARTMSAPQIGRYLDYCSELLSLSSKVAALYVQYFNDPVVLSAVNDIETLATGISSKVWQKITLLERVGAR